MEQERWTLRRDDDSHWYLIPLGMVEQFDEWLEAVYSADVSYTGPSFVKYMTSNISRLSFTDPQVEVRKIEH
jgi:hypothetical protein